MCALWTFTLHPRVWRNLSEIHWLHVKHWPPLNDTFTSSVSTLCSPFNSEFWECSSKSLSPAEHNDHLGYQPSHAYVSYVHSGLFYPQVLRMFSIFAVSRVRASVQRSVCTISLNVSSSAILSLFREFWECSLYSLVLLCSSGSFVFSTLLCSLCLIWCFTCCTFQCKFFECSQESLLCSVITLPFVSISMISITSVLIADSPLLFCNSARSNWRSGTSLAANNNFELLP